jgi:putative ABC transport system substrate-binding protein
VIVVAALPGIRAAKQATSTIPIVMVTTQDPVATGIVDSLARPGGNITGLTRLTRELSGKRLELLKEVVPTISRVAVLFDANFTNPGNNFNEYEPAARSLKMQLQSLEVRGPNPIWRWLSKLPPRAVRVDSSRLQLPCSIVTRSGLRTLPSSADCLRCTKEVSTRRPGASYPMQPMKLRFSGAPPFSWTKS